MPLCGTAAFCLCRRNCKLHLDNNSCAPQKLLLLCASAQAASCDSCPSDCRSRTPLLPAAADASRGVSSLAQLQRPSYLLPGKKKNVQFHTESGEVSHRQGWAARALTVLDPDTLPMRLLDDFRAVMCLYELFAMPLRIALGTGYDRLGASRWVPHLCLHLPWQRSML